MAGPRVVHVLHASARLQEKVSYLRSQAEMELTSAQQRLEQVQKVAEEARRAFCLHFEEAAR